MQCLTKANRASQRYRPTLNQASPYLTFMPEPKKAPYGAWKSPISSGLISFGTDLLVELAVYGDDLYWIESHAREGGRMVLAHRQKDGQTSEVLPSNFNVRTTVHEYGGNCFTVGDHSVYFANFADQRLYRFEPNTEPRPITPQGNLRYADLTIDRKRSRIICVLEDHSVVGREPANSLVTVPLQGGNPPVELVSGNDFYSSPRLSPDESHLAWITWNHPNMPWEGTELYVGDFSSDGSISNQRTAHSTSYLTGQGGGTSIAR